MKQIVHVSGFPSVWEVWNPATVVSLLKSDEVAVPDVFQMLCFIEREFGIELPNLRELATMTPIFMEGPEARQFRKDLATFYGAQTDRVGEELRNSLPGILDKFFSRSTADIEHHLARPISRSMFAAILGREPPEDIFDLHLGELFNFEEKTITSLRRLDASAAKALIVARTFTPRNEPLGLVLSLLIFGVESLVGTFQSSVANVLKNSSRDEPVSFQLPLMPPKTYISYTYRAVVRDIAIGDAHFRQGEVLKLIVNPDTEVAVDTYSQIIFGAGAHSCIGRGIAMTVWGEVRKQVNARQMRLFAEEMHRAKFRFGKLYSKFTVGIA